MGKIRGESFFVESNSEYDSESRFERKKKLRLEQSLPGEIYFERSVACLGATSNYWVSRNEYVCLRNYSNLLATFEPLKVRHLEDTGGLLISCNY